MSVSLGHQFQQAGVFDKALKYYLQAGNGATKLYLYEEARVHYAAAVAMLEQLPETPELKRQNVDILLKQLHVGLYGDTAEARLRRLAKARLLLEALTHSGKAVTEDRLRMARVDYYSGRSLQLNGQPQEAIQHFQRVLPIAKEFGDEDLMLVPACAIGQALFAQGNFGKSRELLEPTIEPMIRQFGASVEAIRCLGYHNNVLGATGHCRQARAGLERLRQWVNEKDHPYFQGLILVLHTPGFLMMADWPTALQMGTQLYEIGTRTNETTHLYMGLDCIAWSQSYLGRTTEAFDARAKALEVRRLRGGGLAADWFNAGEAEMLLNASRNEEALRQAQQVAAGSREAGLPLSLSMAERSWGCALSRLGGHSLPFIPLLDFDK